MDGEKSVTCNLELLSVIQQALEYVINSWDISFNLIGPPLQLSTNNNQSYDFIILQQNTSNDIYFIALLCVMLFNWLMLSLEELNLFKQKDLDHIFFPYCSIYHVKCVALPWLTECCKLTERRSHSYQLEYLFNYYVRMLQRHHKQFSLSKIWESISRGLQIYPFSPELFKALVEIGHLYTTSNKLRWMFDDLCHK